MNAFDAVEAGDARALGLALDSGADVNAQLAGDSLLNLACEGGSFECVKLLLDRGADINAVSRAGHKPLFDAVVSARDIAMVSLLVERGAKLGELNELYDGELKTAAAGLFASDTLNVMDMAFFDQLIERFGADALNLEARLGSPDMGDKTLMLDACEKGFIPLVSRLTDLECDLFALTHPDQRGVLHQLMVNADVAKSMESLAIARGLIEAGADVDAEDDAGITPLHLACDMDEPRLLKEFLDAGADFDKQTDIGRPIDTAFEAQSARCIVLLMHRYGLTPFDDFEGQSIESRLQGNSKQLEYLGEMRGEYAKKVEYGIVGSLFEQAKPVRGKSRSLGMM